MAITEEGEQFLAGIKHEGLDLYSILAVTIDEKHIWSIKIPINVSFDEEIKGTSTWKGFSEYILYVVE